MKQSSVKLNSVTCGDCRCLISALPDYSIDVVVTSPPYCEQRNDHYPGVPEDEYPAFTLESMTQVAPKLARNGSVLIVIDPHIRDGMVSDYVLKTRLLLREHGWLEHQPQKWHKPDAYPMGRKDWPRHAYEEVLWFSLGRKPFCDPWACAVPSPNVAVNRYRGSEWSNGYESPKPGKSRCTDVIQISIGAEKGIDHPAKFPVALAEHLIQRFSPPGGAVLDCFCGSGTTLVAAKKLGRKWYGIDIVQDYCELARKRIAGTARLPRAG